MSVRHLRKSFRIAILLLSVQLSGALLVTPTQAQTSQSSHPRYSLTRSIALKVTNITAIAGDKSATVSWNAPQNLGNRPVLKYTVQAYYKDPITQQRTVKSTVSVDGGQTSVVVPNLSNGMAYDFTITAENSVAWYAVNTSIMARPSGLPCQPASVSATVGNAKATITWARPCNGGATATFAVTVFRGSDVVASRANIADNHTFPSTTFVGLTNGTVYTATVTSTNKNGSVTSLVSPEFSPKR